MYNIYIIVASHQPMATGHSPGCPWICFSRPALLGRCGTRGWQTLLRRVDSPERLRDVCTTWSMIYPITMVNLRYLSKKLKKISWLV